MSWTELSLPAALKSFLHVKPFLSWTVITSSFWVFVLKEHFDAFELNCCLPWEDLSWTALTCCVCWIVTHLTRLSFAVKPCSQIFPSSDALVFRSCTKKALNLCPKIMVKDRTRFYLLKRILCCGHIPTFPGTEGGSEKTRQYQPGEQENITQINENKQHHAWTYECLMYSRFYVETAHASFLLCSI